MKAVSKAISTVEYLFVLTTMKPNLLLARSTKMGQTLTQNYWRDEVKSLILWAMFFKDLKVENILYQGDTIKIGYCTGHTITHYLVTIISTEKFNEYWIKLKKFACCGHLLDIYLPCQRSFKAKVIQCIPLLLGQIKPIVNRYVS